MELIGERGAARVTVDEIAAAAGVSKGTVYSTSAASPN